MAEQETQIIASRYRLIHKLGEGGMGAVYKAFDRLNQQYVALKRVVESAQEMEPGSQVSGTQGDIRTALAHEFQTLASLRHPHVIGVLDYGFDAEQLPFFIMSLLEGAKPLTEFKVNSVEEKIKLIIEVLQALAYLHRRGIVHRDLKPENALVTTDSRVKVLDFGLAALSGKKDGEFVVGTLAYMAPEVLQGNPASEAADLYAVGLMAYEMIAGKHCYKLDDPAQMITDIMFTQPDVHQLDINYALANVIERLLLKQPEDRYQDAYHVIADLSEAIGQKVPEETSAIRESYLQAAQFVGRDAELALLTDALDETTNGHGSGWLVGGENGVGKSRLLDELRIQALVKGALVVHGQGMDDGGLSYQLWREPLRRLVLSVELTHLEATILKEIIPDIGQLLDREVADAPQLQDQAGLDRLLNTISDVIKKQTQPVVFILEDLHWAVESLDVLKHLLALVSELPIMLVGNFRDDERPDLPEELPDMQLIKLERLTDQGIEQLSVSMLGETGSSPEVIELLKKETEGNVYFLVEVVRALAEEAGRLSNIGRITLPKHVFAGGVETIVRRRLDKVPENARFLLRVAAVLGRRLDLKVLQAFQPETDVDNWLTECSNIAILDILDGHWQFAHDKLRTNLLSSILDADSQDLHTRAATILQEVYTDKLDEYAARIADHYEEAHSLGDAAVWYARAGTHARATHAPMMAITYYQKCLDFWGPDSTAPMDAYMGLGSTLTWQGRYDEAIKIFTEARSSAQKENNKVVQAEALFGICSAQIWQGDFKTALETAETLESIAREANAQPELARALHLKGWNAFRMGNTDIALDLGQQALDICEEISDLSHKIQCLNLLGAAHLTIGNYVPAAEYFQQGLQIAEETGNRGPALALRGNLGEIAGARGDYESALDLNLQAVQIAREVGMHDAEMLYMSNAGGAYVRLGDYDNAQNTLHQVIQMAEDTRFGQLSETYRFLAEAQLEQGEIEAALEAAQRSLTLGQKVGAQEFVAASWRVLGEVASKYPGMVILVDDAPQLPFMCFTESQRICTEAKMEGQRAQTLRSWAKFELAFGDRTKGETMWAESRDIFKRLGADLEAERMSNFPGQGS